MEEKNAAISASYDSLNKKYKKLNTAYDELQRKETSSDQYKLASLVSHNADKYCEYIEELKEVITNGAYRDTEKDDEAVEYINNLPLDYGQRIILYRIHFFNDSTYNSDIVDYLNDRDDISYSEMEFILTSLGFAVYEDGTVKW